MKDAITVPSQTGVPSRMRSIYQLAARLWAVITAAFVAQVLDISRLVRVAFTYATYMLPPNIIILH